MSEQWLMIRDGVVENIVEWDGGNDWRPPEGVTMFRSETAPAVSIGWTWTGKDWIAPAEDAPPPAEIVTKDDVLAKLAELTGFSAEDIAAAVAK